MFKTTHWRDLHVYDDLIKKKKKKIKISNLVGYTTEY